MHYNPLITLSAQSCTHVHLICTMYSWAPNVCIQFFVIISDASAVSLPSAAVGWPPVHTSRRHLVTATHVPKPDADVKQPDGPKDAKIPAAAALADDDKEVAEAPTSCTVTAEPQRLPANMFAKVHMDGCLIVRKINLRAHRSYDSLSRALTKMTRNFFCRKYCSQLLFSILLKHV